MVKIDQNTHNKYYSDAFDGQMSEKMARNMAVNTAVFCFMQISRITRSIIYIIYYEKNTRAETTWNIFNFSNDIHNTHNNILVN